MKKAHTLKTFQFIFVCLLLLVSTTKDSTAQEIDQSFIQSLEERITQLEKQVRDLTNKLNTNSTNSPKPDNRRDTKSDSKEVTTSKPTDAEVKAAITACLKKKVPVKWVNHLGNTGNTVVQTVTIKQWGVYNDRQQYWPVNVQVTGSCEVDNIFSKEKRSFNGAGDFRLMKNDYGQWVAIFVEQW